MQAERDITGNVRVVPRQQCQNLSWQFIPLTIPMPGDVKGLNIHWAWPGPEKWNVRNAQRKTEALKLRFEKLDLKCGPNASLT